MLENDDFENDFPSTTAYGCGGYCCDYKVNLDPREIDP
jgi:hypothetical protein